MAWRRDFYNRVRSARILTAPEFPLKESIELWIQISPNPIWSP
jgi:hypothetical protein